MIRPLLFSYLLQVIQLHSKVKLHCSFPPATAPPTQMSTVECLVALFASVMLLCLSLFARRCCCEYQGWPHEKSTTSQPARRRSSPSSSQVNDDCCFGESESLQVKSHLPPTCAVVHRFRTIVRSAWKWEGDSTIVLCIHATAAAYNGTILWEQKTFSVGRLMWDKKERSSLTAGWCDVVVATKKSSLQGSLSIHSFKKLCVSNYFPLTFRSSVVSENGETM